jgi:hypothetical protein
VLPWQEGDKKLHQYRIHGLKLRQMEEGQKMGKMYQKFVTVLLEDWVCGGLGRVNGLMSSSSIGSRTAVQNPTRSWMTSLALASGVGSLDLVNQLSERAGIVQRALHQSQNLSASAITELRRRCGFNK